MKYLIKSLKWTKNNGIETWYKPNSNGYTYLIFYAGIYTDEDMKRMTDVISQKVIQFIPVSNELKQKGIRQLKHRIKEYEYDIEKANNIIKDSTEQIKILKSQIESFENLFDT
jgi:hypothetical protein